MVTIHGISILVYFGLGCPWFPHSSNYMDLSWGGTIHTISHVHFLWRVGNAVHSLVKCISVCVQQSSATAGNGCHQPSTSAEISNEGRHALKSWSWDFWWFLSPNHQKNSFSEDVWARFNASLKDLKVLEPNVLWELLPKSETRMTRNIMVLVATRSQRCLFNDRRDSLIAMFDVCLWQRWWFTQQHKRTRHHCASKVARPDATVSHHVARSTMLKGRSGKRVPLKLGIWANMANGRQNEFSVHMQSSNTWQEPRSTSKGRSEEP